MSASKKTTSKSAKSPAPATKPAAAKAPAKKKVTAAPVSAPTPAPAARVAPAPVPAPLPVATPAVKSVKTAPVLTTIAARIDIGFGNALFIRGEGPGLSWDRGLAMECVADDLWQVTLGESARAFTFKFLVNDLSWSVGPDYTVAAGSSVTLTPEF